MSLKELTFRTAMKDPAAGGGDVQMAS